MPHLERGKNVSIEWKLPPEKKRENKRKWKSLDTSPKNKARKGSEGSEC